LDKYLVHSAQLLGASDRYKSYESLQDLV